MVKLGSLGFQFFSHQLKLKIRPLGSIESKSGSAEVSSGKKVSYNFFLHLQNEDCAQNNKILVNKLEVGGAF